MIPYRSEYERFLLTALLVVAACNGTEPGNGSADTPELVFLERDETNGQWSVRGQTAEGESLDLAPGPHDAPRPSGVTLLVRPTTGELLYATNLGDPGHALLDPVSGESRGLDLPGPALAWSPRGDRLAVVVDQAVVVITLDGRVHRTICGPPAICGIPAWTPDGEAVAISRTMVGGKPDIWRVSLADGGETNLTATAPASETNPAWSPDGASIAYYQDEDLQLIVANADGSEPRRLFAPISPDDPVWQLSGDTLAVRGTLDGELGVIRVPLSGMPSLVTPPGERPEEAAGIQWSPSGDRLAFLTTPTGEPSHPAVVSIRADGGDRRQLSRPGNAAADPAWILR
jgi:Tol biopolymer transport system component